MRILLAQTDPDSTAIFTTALEAAGHEVLTTDSGEQAIRLALEHRPDVVMTELVLPLVDGWQIVQMLRTYGPLRDTPIVALTSHVAEEDRSRALESGFAEYLTLPLDPLRLVEAVERIAGERWDHAAREDVSGMPRRAAGRDREATQ